MRTATDLLTELNAIDESVRIEAKRASEIGKSVLETVIAYANEPGLGGGYLLLGVNWKTDAKGDVVYWPEGLTNLDKIQRDLASQCASMPNQALRPAMQIDTVDGKPVLVVFVPEVDVAHKPVYLKATGLPRGAFRRIGSSDQRCVDEDLWVLRGESQPQAGPDMASLHDARRDDLDPQAIAEYRRLRALVNADAEELAYHDDDLLEAICALRRVDGQPRPTVAGIVLFGKPLALRRLMPALRIDYIRVSGTQWVDDPDQRFTTTLDIRKPLVLALRQVQNVVRDDLPRGFRLDAGELQSRQEPILPDKVIREALANATMHRSYQEHGAVQVIRYSNRIEVLNPGYSLKPVADLGTPGSRLRNPAIAAVLHDLQMAETKGSGIRSMRSLCTQAGLPPPEFSSDRRGNEFKAILFLHNLLTEDDYRWLKALTGRLIGPQAHHSLNADEAKALIYARETGAVDNTACRDFSALDTLAASLVLRRLRDRGLLVKQGSGSRTYYKLPQPLVGGAHATESTQAASGDSGDPHKPTPESTQALAGIPQALQQRILAAGKKPRKATLRTLLLELCALQPFTAAELCRLLGRSSPNELTRAHLKPLREAGKLALLYPESAKHPHQAYMTTNDNRKPDHG
jgi:ATP-dependent DNA helicase RecG